MDLNLRLCITRNEKDEKISGVYFQDGGYSLTYIPLEKAAEMLVSLWESHTERDQAIKTVALRLEYMERYYNSEILGEPGDRKIESLVLKHFGIEKGFSGLEAQLSGVWY